MNKIIIIEISSNLNSNKICLGAIPSSLHQSSTITLDNSNYDPNFAFEISIPCAIKQNIFHSGENNDFKNISTNVHSINLSSMGLSIDFILYKIYSQKEQCLTNNQFSQIAQQNSPQHNEFVKKIEQLIEMPTFSMSNVLPQGFESFVDSSNKSTLLDDSLNPDLKKFCAYIQKAFFNDLIPSTTQAQLPKLKSL